MRFASGTFRGGPSLRQRVYESLWSNLTDGGRTPNYARGGYTDAKVWATACALARWLATAQRLERQISADTVLELLPDREAEFGVIVPAGATLAQRRVALRLAMRRPARATYGALRQALVDLLGASFVELRQLPAWSLVTAPPVPFNGPGLFIHPNPRRVTYKLATSISSPEQMQGQVAVPFVHLNGQPLSTALAGGDGRDLGESLFAEGLQVGEKFVVEPGHNVLLERTQVIFVEPVAVPGLGETLGLRAPFAHPHHAGALLTNQPYPYLYSNRRHWVVQLTAAAALDPHTRGQVHWLMARTCRGVTTWDVVGSAGGFTLGSSPLGATPLG